MSGIYLDELLLNGADHSIAISDGTNTLAINADGSLNTKTAVGAAMKASAETVTTTAAQVLTTPLANRTSVIIQNEGTQSVYVGHDNTVTSSNGIKISKASSATLEVGDGVDIYMLSASGSMSVRFLEIA